MGQCTHKGTDEETDIMRQAVSLDQVKSRSSNAALTSSRYHYLHDVPRKLSDDYVIDGRVLGQGLCGNVVLVRGKIDGQKYALKTVSKRHVNPAKVQQLTAEVEIYLTLDHPNIARLHDVYETDSEIHLVTECCEGGELYFRLQKRGVYTDADAADAARQMLRAVGYLHSHHVVHRDLKLENFLNESDRDDSQLKLIDFGFAKIWDPSTLMMASCGSIAYVSPDVLCGRGYTNKCDLWSLGVIVWMLLVGYPPFHGDEKEMMAKIRAGQADWSHKGRWKPVSEDAVGFLRQLLSRSPAQRPDAQEALRHRWLLPRGGAPRAPATLNRSLLRSLQSYASASKVRRAVLQLLALELAPDETRELRETFLAIDRSNEGTICLSDLKDAIRSGGGASAARSPQRRRRLQAEGATPVHAHDGTPRACGRSPPRHHSRLGDGTPGGAASPVTPAQQLRRANSGVLDELFQLLDGNGDERIYYSDFLAATVETRSRNREVAVRAAFSRLDADGSGTIGVKDFRDVMGETFEGVCVEELVAGADPSGSGEINFDTFVRVLEDRDVAPAASPARTPLRGPPAALSPSRKRLQFFPESAGAYGGS